MHSTIIKDCRLSNNNSLETEVYLEGALIYAYIHTHALRIHMHDMQTFYYIALHGIYIYIYIYVYIYIYIYIYIYTYLHIFVFKDFKLHIREIK